MRWRRYRRIGPFGFPHDRPVSRPLNLILNLMHWMGLSR